MPTTVDTSTSATALIYSWQRKVDRCQNGVLWATFNIYSSTVKTADFIETWYSTDNGATWIFSGTIANLSGATTNAHAPSHSFFIDLDDYAHVVFKDQSTGVLGYRRGTPNAGRTAWTWSAALQLEANGFDMPDVIAHREGTGWVAHAVYSTTVAAANSVTHARINIDSTGTITGPTKTNIGGPYVSGAHRYPTIDFHHTGNGKTVQGGTPHLYIAWSAGEATAGRGIRFKKATYSAGAWTFGTEREIDATRYVPSTSFWMNCMFDGTRVIIGGQIGESSSAADADLVLYERDVADTTTTTRILVSNIAVNDSLYFGSLTYDGAGDVYFSGVELNSVSNARNAGYRKWVRSTTTLGARVTLDSTSTIPYVAYKRGYSNNYIELLYMDNAASPHNIVYDSIVLNVAPNTPTNLQVTSDVLDTTPVFSADISDANPGQQIKGRFQVYQNDGTTLVATIESAFRTGNGNVTVEYASALPPGNYKLQAAAVDDLNLVSAYTAQISFQIKTTVEKDIDLRWEVDILVEKNLSVSWNVLSANQKDLGIYWVTTVQAEKDLAVLWGMTTIWYPVDTPAENVVTWEEVPT